MDTLQAAFTSKELREMISLPDTKLDMDVDLVRQQVEANKDILSKDRPRRRLMDLLLKGAANSQSSSIPASRSWHLQFLSSPVNVNVNQVTNTLESVVLEKNKLEGPLDRPRAVGTGEMDKIDCGLLVRSIGYKSVPLSGVPFNPTKGLIPNVRGKVVDEVCVPCRPVIRPF